MQGDAMSDEKKETGLSAYTSQMLELAQLIEDDPEWFVTEFDDQMLVDALRSAAAVRAKPMTVESIERAFSEWRKTLKVVDNPTNQEIFGQGYIAGWNAKEVASADVQAAGLPDVFDIAMQALRVGALGLSEPIRQGIARSITLRLDASRAPPQAVRETDQAAHIKFLAGRIRNAHTLLEHDEDHKAMVLLAETWLEHNAKYASLSRPQRSGTDV
jgi:hypothetical protein